VVNTSTQVDMRKGVAQPISLKLLRLRFDHVKDGNMSIWVNRSTPSSSTYVVENEIHPFPPHLWKWRASTALPWLRYIGKDFQRLSLASWSIHGAWGHHRLVLFALQWTGESCFHGVFSTERI